ncbi:hypothetical protein LLG95_16675 [bacterium]|nr:hypothetical protein [bacterium]
MRLGAYHHWDPSLSRLQFGAIEKHLSECPECRAEWERTSELCYNLEQLRRGMAGEPSIEEQVANLMVRINECETEQATYRETCAAGFRRYGYKLAAAMCILVIALPVLGYMGQQVLIKYIGAGESLILVRDMVYRNSARVGVPIEMLAAVCLILIALPLGYMGHRVLKEYLRPRESATGVGLLTRKNSAMTKPPAETKVGKSMGGQR